ncbi:2-amino-5-chloromuconate deaminase CnbZ [Ottowia thiooxydans]|uniref:2-amino-5-chloromuconate deaminase CnbZ n=1 Tax=Ottowia thiooxydans TaxID=219182 RepID=UPI000407F753|nr:hypothetical protein [Ottowia thiooxydans]
MAEVIAFNPGNYRYVRGVRQYSCGVAAEPGYRLERARFSRPLPLKEGFERIAAHLQAKGRPLTAFAACELRSPAPFTEEGFRAFNDVYIGTLKTWGIYEEGADNPVARSNVCPEFHKPAEPSLYAFSYTVVHEGAVPSFVVAGSAEALEGKGDYRDNCVRLGDISREGLSEKGRWVLGEMSRRMEALGFTWDDTTGVQLYTVHPIQHVMLQEMAPQGIARNGVDWHFNRPPVKDLEFEMDCRGVASECVLTV